MPRDVIFKRQYFSSVSDQEIAGLQSSPSALTEFLDNNSHFGLDRWWQAVPYLITGKTTGLEEPLRWFTDGGEEIGSNTAGSIRYLAPLQVTYLADALAEEEPDELGHTQWDEAGMDAAGVYPQRWVRDGEDYDQLSNIRETYSYVRQFFMDLKRDRKGVIIHLKEEVAFTEEADEEPTTPTSPAPAVTPSQPAGEVVMVTADGRQFTRADAARHPNATPQEVSQADATLKQLGYRHLGDLGVRETDIVRTYLADDRTILAVAYFGSRGLGSWTFLAPLEKDALVVASDAFTREVKKVKLFALSLSRSDPAGLHASVVERRAGLEKKHGAPVVLEPTLAAAGKVWETYGAKFEMGPRR